MSQQPSEILSWPQPGVALAPFSLGDTAPEGHLTIAQRFSVCLCPHVPVAGRLKGGNNTAQGDALGIGLSSLSQALKGRENPHAYFALSGLEGMRARYSQGVALGCIIPALQAVKPRHNCAGAIPRLCGYLCLLVLVLLTATGCASHGKPLLAPVAAPATSDTPAFARAQQAVREAFPPAYRAIQRAILTVRQRQYAFDGVLTVSPKAGGHLALVSTLGLVAEVRSKNDGSCEVVRVTPLFREEWAREYVAPELLWLFTPPTNLAPAGYLADGRLALKAQSRTGDATALYICSRDGRRWEGLQVSKGSHRLFNAKLDSYRSFPGWPQPMPAELEVDAGSHQLQLRVAALQPAAEGTR